MLNERKLTKSELAKREDIIMKMKKNKRALTQKYGKDAEAVMYGRATKLAKKQAEAMDQDKIKELVKDALQNPKKADLNKDGKLSDYEKKRGAAIEKSMEKQDLKEFGSSDMNALLSSMHINLGYPKEFPGLSKIMDAAEDATDFYMDDFEEYSTNRDELVMSNARAYARREFPDFMAQAAKFIEPIDEMDINDPIAMRLRADKAKRAANAGDDGNDKFFDAAKLRALKAKRAEIMRDMEQEAEMEGGPIADRYGDMLNVVDAEIAKEKAMMGLEEEFDFDVKGGTEPDKDADVAGILGAEDVLGLEEGASTEEKRIAMRAIKSIAKYRGVSNDEARNDLVRAAKEIGDLKEDLDLGHQDNEPHMLKADLYRIGKYAMELYQMVDRFEESSEEVDFPHWWQSKVIKAKDALVGAKHYLDFEIKEPQIDVMVDVAAEEDAIDENSAFQKRLAKLAASEKAKREKNPGYAKASKLDVDFEDFIEKGQSYGEFKKRLDKLDEGTWSIGSSKDIKSVMDALDQMMDFKNPKDIVRYLSKLDKFLYNTIGDDVFHDDIDGAKSEASEGNMDRAMNRLSDAYSRAEYFLERQMDREGLKEEEAGEVDKVASDIQKAMNKHKKDDAKMHQLKQARTAMNKGDLDKAKKIIGRYLKEGLPKGYWDKKMDAEDEVNELLDDTPAPVVAKANNKIVNVATMAKSLLDIYDDFKAKEKIDFEANSNFVQALKFLTKAAQPQIDKETKGNVAEDYDALVNKIKKQGKSEKAAKAIAGAVASYKAKGGGKGPTAKQKARG